MANFARLISSPLTAVQQLRILASEGFLNHYLMGILLKSIIAAHLLKYQES